MKTHLKKISERLFGRRYYAVIVGEAGSDRYDIASQIHASRASAEAVFKKNAKVDISAFVGKEIRFTKVNYTTQSLNESLYGLAFYNSSNTFISGIRFPKNEDVAGSAATYFAIGTIPQDTKYIGVTYLNDAKIAEIDGLTFKIEVAV
jgi:hypothetical protein